MKQLLKAILKPEVFTYLFTLAFLLTLNNKIYILMFVFYGLALFFTANFSLITSLFSALLLSLIFERGLRDWFIEVVQPNPQEFVRGYSFYFGLTPKLLLSGLLLMVFLISTLRKNQKIKTPSSVWVLLLFYGCAVVSTLFASGSQLAIFGLIRIVTFIVIYLLGRELFTHKTVRTLLPHILVGFLLLEGVVGTLQFFHRQPVGFFLEDSGTSGPLGYITTDSVLVYRVTGFTGHPTYFGSLLSLLLPAVAGIILYGFKKTELKGWPRQVAILALILGALSLVGTFSRSAWIAIALALILFVWKQKKTSLTLRSGLIISAITTIIVAVSFYLPEIIYRVGSFSDILSIGNGRGRLTLISQALTMIRSAPFWGVGLNNFTKIASLQDLSLEAKTFLYPVHNTFLLFLSELGIPAGILFMLFVFLAFKEAWRAAQKNWLNFGVWVGAATFVLNAQFHTLFNLDPSLDVFMVMLAYLSVL